MTSTRYGRARSGGLTLIELMVGLAIAAILLVAAAPAFTDYIVNSRLRESGNLLYSQTLLAQSEAIKRNTVIRLSTSGSVVQVIDRTDPDAPVVLFERRLSDGVTMSTATVDFVGEGRPQGFAAAAINLATGAGTCSSDTRCPGLRIDGGGGVRLCGDHTAGCT
jgi:type IV fimbrial biogenesis protein FimT